MKLKDADFKNSVERVKAGDVTRICTNDDVIRIKDENISLIGYIDDKGIICIK